MNSRRLPSGSGAVRQSRPRRKLATARASSPVPPPCTSTAWAPWSQPDQKNSAGATVAALTVYDMSKALSHAIVLGPAKLLGKHGGKRDFGKMD